MSVPPAAPGELLLKLQALVALADSQACPEVPPQRSTRRDQAKKHDLELKDVAFEEILSKLYPGDLATGDKLAQFGAAARWSSELGVPTMICAQCDINLIWDEPARSLDRLHTLERGMVRCRAQSPAQALDHMYAGVAKMVTDE